MRFSDWVRAWLLTLGLALPLATADASGRVEVPLNQRVLSDGTIRYFVNISVAGSPPIAAMVDTGSTGLRILPHVVPDKAFASISSQSSIYGYGSGVRLDGVVATLRVNIGSSSPGAISAQLVRTVDCFPKQPQCPASRLSQSDYRIGGDGLAKEGFDAILGISMGTGPVDNPLRQLGAKTWIVILPRPGEKGPGSLVLDPTAGEVAGYTLFPTQRRLGGAGAPDAIPGCLVIGKGGQKICGPTLLDSGAPGISISSSNPAERSGWKKGDALGLAFTNKQGGEVQATFESGANQPSHVSAPAPKDGSPSDTHIAAGTEPYFLFSVLYDDPRHLVGLKLR